MRPLEWRHRYTDEARFPREAFKQAFAVSRDGGSLVFGQVSTFDAFQDLYLIQLDQPAETARPLLATGFDERNADISPNGRWMAYESNQAG
jgi:Tol biopolymer transport system component